MAAESGRTRETVRQSFAGLLRDRKYLCRTLILFVITAGQNIPSFIFLGWNNAFLQASGVPQADALLSEYVPKADTVFAQVTKQLRT